MSQVLELFPARVPIGYANGVAVIASPEFIRALQTTMTRLGGPVGPSTTDLAQSDDDDSGLEEFKAEFTKAINGLEMAPPVVFDPFRDPLYPIVQEHAAYTDPLHPLSQAHSEVQQLQTELAGLREEVAVLRSLINAIQQGTAL